MKIINLKQTKKERNENEKKEQKLIYRREEIIDLKIQEH